MITTRKELVEQFGDRLSGYIEEYVEEKKTRTGWLKTQILEVDISEKSFEDTFNQYLSKAKGLIRKAKLLELNDTDFYKIQANDDADDIYVDALDHRFVVLYSFMKSDEFEKIIETLTNDSVIDQSWLPQEFMLSLDQLGLFKGYGGRFNNEFFVNEPGKSLDDNPDFRSLSFKSWGHTKRLLQLIQDDEVLKNEFALTNMRIKKAYDTQVDNDTIIDDITYSGRITSLGHSFRAHHEIITKLLREYKNLVVNVIENNYAVHLEDNSVKGERLFFKLHEPLKDFNEFATKLFSGKRPFKLWGVNSYSREEFTRFEVLDMHINETFTADVFSDRIIILLEKGVCGNTILRLTTLLQQHFGSGISLVDKEDNIIHLGISSEQD